ncbi:hypothetical protein NDU88_002392 [Pleurodeles waltl]|uniref:Uncharacterized protein n=1 Tax=Pleurodeles waltl TaxID=8319 RepID=A0AAV7RFM8_PLEWA|nr:hypothetical protein NDU88_002392 [Pleurodeles waltl]
MHSLHHSEKINTRRAKTTQPVFARKGSTQRQRSDRKFDAWTTGSTHSRAGTTQPDILRGIDAAPAMR